MRSPKLRGRGSGLVAICAFWLSFASTAQEQPGKAAAATEGAPVSRAPYVIVLGIAQDGGYPQAGTRDHPAWDAPSLRRHAASLGIVDPSTGQRWIVDATPDFREQLHALDGVAPAEGKPGLDGIFLTHAHIGHYTGLVHLGHEAMGASGVRVFAMPRMAGFLRTNGPWSQLVSYENIVLEPLTDGEPAILNGRLSVTPIAVPHRQEFSEVVGFVIRGPERAVLFLPDIDSWEEWEDAGTRVEEVIGAVDVAYLDATFFGDGEIPGRDMSGFPHPLIELSMQRFAGLPSVEKRKVRFIHLNHTNPAIRASSSARRMIEQAGFAVAEEGEVVSLARSAGLGGESDD